MHLLAGPWVLVAVAHGCSRRASQVSWARTMIVKPPAVARAGVRGMSCSPATPQQFDMCSNNNTSLQGAHRKVSPPPRKNLSATHVGWPACHGSRTPAQVRVR